MNASDPKRATFVTGVVLWISAGALAMVGCAGPAGSGATGGFTMPGGRAPSARNIPSPALPGTGQNPAMPGVNTSAALVTDAQPSIRQVGFLDHGRGSDCSSGCCPPRGGSCLSGCNSGACPPVTPHGYAIPPAQPWNLHGIDPQEFVCDGGDHDPAAVLLRDDTLAGLQNEDTVAHYTTEAGDIHVQPSTRACVYSPRFSAVRSISSAASGGRVIGLSGVSKPVGPNRFNHQTPRLVINDVAELGHADITRRPDAMRDRNRGVRIGGVIQPLVTDEIMVVLATLQRQGMGQLRDTDLALIQRLSNAAIAWTIDESVEVAVEDLKAPTLIRDQKVDALTTYEFPDEGRLQIIKLADRAHAQPGEKVSFMIQVQNVGDSPVDHIVLTDNLTTRLQYVEDSQTCSVDAEFETEINGGQSLRLQWAFGRPMAVGDIVEIRFECLLR